MNRKRDVVLDSDTGKGNQWHNMMPAIQRLATRGSDGIIPDVSRGACLNIGSTYIFTPVGQHLHIRDWGGGRATEPYYRRGGMVLNVASTQPRRATC